MEIPAKQRGSYYNFYLFIVHVDGHTKKDSRFSHRAFCCCWTMLDEDLYFAMCRQPGLHDAELRTNLPDMKGHVPTDGDMFLLWIRDVSLVYMKDSQQEFDSNA